MLWFELTEKQNLNPGFLVKCSTKEIYIYPSYWYSLPNCSNFYIILLHDWTNYQFINWNIFCLYLKEEARSTIRRALDECDFGRTECVVRVNSVTSGLMEDDLGEVLGARRMPDTLMLPKVERPQDIDMV